jgi:biopolymer transport protein ExbB
MNWLSNAVGLLVRGGPVMVPLLLCSIVALTVVIERFLCLRAALTDRSETVVKVEEYLRAGHPDKAAALCQQESGPVMSMLSAGVSNRHLGPDGAERVMVARASKETHGMTARLSWLDTVITIAPLLGLLGTVTGMIRSFHVISSRDGISTPTAITGGVAEALIATATGLAIAIFTLICYNALNEKIREVTGQMETAGTSLVSVLTEIREKRDEVTVLSA